MFFPKLLVKCFYLWPSSKGRYRLFTLLSEETKAKLDEVLPQPARMKSGIKLFVRPGDHLSRWFRYFGAYEKSTSEMLREHANPNAVFVDVGANLGIHSLGLARDIGCDVAAFEPSPVTADCFDRSIAVNDLGDKVTAFRVALSDEEGTATFVEPPHHVGQASLESNTVPEHREGGRFDVTITSLDKYAEFQNYLSTLGKPVGLIKMDVEGAEEKALRGMSEVLKEHQPVIIMELYDGNLNGFDSSRGAIIALLDELGYDLAEEIEYNGLFLPRVTQQKNGKSSAVEAIPVGCAG